MAKTGTILRKELDPLMEIAATVNPDFYSEYQAARVIRNLRGRTVKETNPPITPPTGSVEPEYAAAA